MSAPCSFIRRISSARHRLLVQPGPDGLAASDIAERLGIPANTLSFDAGWQELQGEVRALNRQAKTSMLSRLALRRSPRC